MASDMPEEVPVLLDNQIDPVMFSEDEVPYAYYLKHFSTLANAVVMKGEHRGFIDLKVWRRPRDNEPYNARILENHASLSFFYTLERPWNPYFGHAALKARLEAVMDFWCRVQHTDGRFSEYAPAQWSLAPTGFGIKFMGETLRRLRESEAAGGPTVDPEILKRTVGAARKAIGVLLTHPDLLRHATNFSNQYTGFWGGMMAFLSAYPDESVYRQFVEMVHTFREQLTSPVGYHYERSGCDWHYTMGTHRNNVRHVWRYVRGTEVGRILAEMERPWVDWLSFNAVLEPDGAYFTMNRAIETRTALPGFVSWETPVAEEIPMAHAFAQPQSAYVKKRTEEKVALVENWPQIASLTSYSPHVFVDGHANMDWRPTDAQRAKAQSKLPYLAQNRFTHLRMDNRRPVQFVFVRRPDYYAAFNAGEIIHPMQKYGLGLLWHPRMGTVLQAQSQDMGPWGTAPVDGGVYEGETFQPEMAVDGKGVTPTAGIHDLPDGEVAFAYSLGTAGQKAVRFAENYVEVVVNHAGAFVEHVPLLCRSAGELTVTEDAIRAQREAGTMVITCSPGVQIETQATDVAHGPFALTRVRVQAQDQLTYRISFEA